MVASEKSVVYKTRVQLVSRQGSGGLLEGQVCTKADVSSIHNIPWPARRVVASNSNVLAGDDMYKSDANEKGKNLLTR
jgi:hypothetical protein